MANTFVKIETVTVGSGGAASIAFSSIPQTYTDLKLVFSLRSNRTGAINDFVKIAVNGSFTSYTATWVGGTGSGVSAYTQSSAANIVGDCPAADATASIFSNNEIYMPNYTTANYKSLSADSVSEHDNTGGIQDLLAGLRANSDAITSLSFTPGVGTLFLQYSSATLYGIGNVTAAGPAKATGGIITYDTSYVYHIFPWSGTFTPTQSITADYLVVAGAGGGGGPGVSGGGGGGAGGVRCTVGATGGGGSLETALSLTAQAYTVTVGAGGAANTIGNNSVFSTITSTAGGRGKDSSTGTNSIGGSGGGGNGTIGGGGAGNTTGAVGTANQGFAGGDGFPGPGDNARNSGGGGGAGSVGTNASSTLAGNGGSGITTSISGTSTVYAGGGGGGVGYGTRGTGTDGGGNGGNGSTAGVAGTANTGSGGGGGGRDESTGGTQVAGAGGSGIVIVRYAR